MNPYLVLICVTVSVIVIGASLMYLIESPLPDSQIKTMLDSFWWTVATITTVGYGDVVPVSDVGRTFGIFYMFFGFIIAGVFLSILATRFYKKRIDTGDSAQKDSLKKLAEKIENMEKQNKEEFEGIKDQLKKLDDKK